MDIKKLLHLAKIDFTGVCVQDAQRIELVRKIGATLSWVASKERINKCNKILIAGNDKIGKEHEDTYNKNLPQLKERGKFFIADIDKIINMNEYLRQTKGYGDLAIQQHHCNHKYPILVDKDGQYWDKRRVVIYFKNPTEIMYFPSLTGGHNITFWASSVGYV